MTGDVLIVGSGAREHALAWKLRQSDRVGRLYVAPGNPGTAALAENVPIGVTDIEGMCRFVEERDVSLTVIGPEAPLPLGLADRLRAAGRLVVGPAADAARLEASKSFAKDVMNRAGVPTARSTVVDDPDAARRLIATHEYPLVVKADGLAAGKGVWICRDAREAEEAIEAMMVRRLYGAAGERIVVEEALEGPEVSLIAFVDGTRAVPFPLAQDHKRLGSGDEGPNTGGMGAYAPVPFVTGDALQALSHLAIEPVVAELAAMGMPYRGIIFAGLMMTEDGPRVLEYNCRFGDPEAQVLLPLLRDDLLPWLEAVAAGDLAGSPSFHEESAIGVVLAAPGYPEKPITGAPIEGLDDVLENVLVFHAGTTRDESGRLLTAGGRVLTVVGRGPTIDAAAGQAYASPIHFEGMQRRDDIAWQARRDSSGTNVVGPHTVSGPVGQGFSPVNDHTVSHHDPVTMWGPSAALVAHRAEALPYDGSAAKPRLGVLASGEGSNLQALIDACARGDLDAEVALVISHRAEAGALQRAERAGIPAMAFPLRSPRDRAARRAMEERILRHIREHDLNLLVLAGWMLILSPDFLARCPIPILNVHPALLPDGSGPLDIPVLRGAHAVRDAIDLGLPYTGVSVHLVTEEVDAGPVVVRAVVPIEPGDVEESLYGRIKAVEHRLLPQAVQTVLFTIHTGGVHA